MSGERSWGVTRFVSEAGDYTHTWPLGDHREHVVRAVGQCWCEPRLWDGCVLVHRSLDNREVIEAYERRMAMSRRASRAHGGTA